ncbi:hypothetical protein M413DRAFT_79992 [Hebeloma cylindrosporum]|uniref:C3H1-type domain-containing protein n=1 Tax=Hebeloma cylindrosporum TaxID=76867 RepID=A0A0C2X9Y1_HEBCY|nr:hypothetical protein M413DRAFT_79992 [Hebeloma cylindrosporum h7]
MDKSSISTTSSPLSTVLQLAKRERLALETQKSALDSGVIEPKRRVNTAAEWSSAWHLASRAIEFAFPNRTRELGEYGRYIEGEFSAKLSSAHSHVILFDIAIRNIVQGGQCCLLTDRDIHLQVYSSVLLPEGANSAISSGSNRRNRDQKHLNTTKSDICNRFNTPGECPSSDVDCRYKHICKRCKRTGHGQDDCTK